MDPTEHYTTQYNRGQDRGDAVHRSLLTAENKHLESREINMIYRVCEVVEICPCGCCAVIAAL